MPEHVSRGGNWIRKEQAVPAPEPKVEAEVVKPKPVFKFFPSKKPVTKPKPKGR